VADSGYDFAGPALDLGALIVDGTARKDARIQGTARGGLHLPELQLRP